MRRCRSHPTDTPVAHRDGVDETDPLGPVRRKQSALGGDVVPGTAVVDGLEDVLGVRRRATRPHERDDRRPALDPPVWPLVDDAIGENRLEGVVVVLVYRTQVFAEQDGPVHTRRSGREPK